MLKVLATMLNREPADVGRQVLIGPPEECASKLRRYAEIGVARVFIWPLADPNAQLEPSYRTWRRSSDVDRFARYEGGFDSDAPRLGVQRPRPRRPFSP